MSEDKFGRVDSDRGGVLRDEHRSESVAQSRDVHYRAGRTFPLPELPPDPRDVVWDGVRWTRWDGYRWVPEEDVRGDHPGPDGRGVAQDV